MAQLRTASIVRVGRPGHTPISSKRTWGVTASGTTARTPRSRRSSGGCIWCTGWVDHWAIAPRIT